ncbi:FEZ-like protein [Nesidiocoris tenuis]|uniref:FEZ-like protein n=1 Tax=Nesidiocoris tenuis TaxID=355587 RepID=A0ABN7BA83_9HEMI|nr:FEZ-like protein [Nesidiocoris tenuis]
MRDTTAKMAELQFEAPLAKLEEAEDWGQVPELMKNDTSTVQQSNLDDVNLNNLKNVNKASAGIGDVDNSTTILKASCLCSVVDAATTGDADNFTETFSGSLEDLVNTFDDKITRCFCNYDESVEKLAPVQVRSQEEIMNECQMWWTITGNFGNILPIDWSKSYARKLHMPALNLNENKSKVMDEGELSSEDEAVASDLDMHKLEPTHNQT